MDISANVVKVRRGLGLTQTVFGQLLGVHGMTVSKWERGLLHPGRQKVAMMIGFQRATKKEDVKERLKQILVAESLTAALSFLLG